MMYNCTREEINKLIVEHSSKLKGELRKFRKLDPVLPAMTNTSQCPDIKYRDIRDKIMPEIKKALIAASKAELRDAYCRGQTLDMMIDLACSNYQACRSNLAGRHIRSFTLPPIVDDAETQCVRLAGRIFKEDGFYSHKKCLGPMRNAREVKGEKTQYEFAKKGTRDSILIIDKALGTYTLYVPQADETPTHIENRHKFVALDPGYRTLLSGISESHAIIIGDKIMLKMDKYVAKMKKLHLIRRKRTRIKKIKAAKAKLHRQVDAMHWVMASYLAKNYDNVMIGDMSPVRIISKQAGLPSAYKRKMVLLRYGKFRERLEYKCHQHSVGFMIVDESFTSRACSACGFMKEKTSSKIHECPSCRCVMDRDINSARNIYCKHL
jgi:hypothetical protein